VRNVLTIFILALYAVGVYPSGALAQANSVKLKIIHSHGHSHEGHGHHQHGSENDHSKQDDTSHSHEVLVSGPALGHVSTHKVSVKIPLQSISSLPIIDHFSQLGQRLSSIFRPPIC
jgi:hypothetical protein